jgi:spore cortex biosynthesis protein YabQ
MLLSGFLLGTVFDFYNTITGASNWLRWLRPTLDFIFWIAAALLVFRLSLDTDQGRFRLYTFGLLLVGYMVYVSLAKRYVIGSAFAIVRLVRAIILMVWRFIYILLLRPLIALLRIGFSILKVMYRVGLRVENWITWMVGHLMRILLFPFTPYLRWVQPIYKKITHYGQGIWIQLSNLLRKSPNGA